MLTRLMRWLGIDPIDVEIIYDEPDMVTMPLEQWHRVFERVRVAEARVMELERQVAAMEQGR